MNSKTALLLLALAALAGTVACNDSSMGGQGGVSVYLTDAPLDLTGVSAVNVTLSGVVLYPGDAGQGDGGGIELSKSQNSFRCTETVIASKRQDANLWAPLIRSLLSQGDA